MKLAMGEDGRHLALQIDPARSTAAFQMLYTSLTNAALFPKLTPEMVNLLLNEIVTKILKIDLIFNLYEIPMANIYGCPIAISLIDGGLQDNCLIARLRLDNPW